MNGEPPTDGGDVGADTPPSLAVAPEAPPGRGGEHERTVKKQALYSYIRQQVLADLRSKLQLGSTIARKDVEALYDLDNAADDEMLVPVDLSGRLDRPPAEVQKCAEDPRADLESYVAAADLITPACRHQAISVRTWREADQISGSEKVECEAAENTDDECEPELAEEDSRAFFDVETSISEEVGNLFGDEDEESEESREKQGGQKNDVVMAPQPVEDNIDDEVEACDNQPLAKRPRLQNRGVSDQVQQDVHDTVLNGKPNDVKEKPNNLECMSKEELIELLWRLLGSKIDSYTTAALQDASRQEVLQYLSDKVRAAVAEGHCFDGAMKDSRLDDSTNKEEAIGRVEHKGLVENQQTPTRRFASTATECSMEKEPASPECTASTASLTPVSEWSKDSLPPCREHELEFMIDEPKSYRQGKSVLSAILPLQGGAFRFRLLVFPMGTDSTSKPEQLAAFVEVVPPEGSQEARWAFEGVKYQISVINWKDYRRTATQTDAYTFRWDSADRGWHRGFLKAVDMTMDSGWLSENGELCLRASCFARKAMLIVPATSGGLVGGRHAVGYVGLKNHGATCYMNCLLQTLFHIGRFREIVYSIDCPEYHGGVVSELQNGQAPVSEDDTFDGNAGAGLGDERPALPLLIALQNLFYRLQTSEVPVSCRELMRSFGWDTADAFMQHDAQELNRLLCDRLEEQMKRTPMDGEIKRLFEGEMENYIDCLDVQYSSTRSETFYDLQLNVKNDAGKDLTSLEESLRDFTSEETLEGDNAYDAGIHGKQRARKGIRFKRFPPVLYIQLKRFMFDAERMDMCKINGRLEFPLVLDLEALAPGSGKYALHTVVVHSGGVSSGHYYAFVRVRDGESGGSRWLKFDDEQVTPCSEQAAVEDNYGGEDPMIWNYFQLSARQLAERPVPTAQRIHNAYMLSYVRMGLLEQVLSTPNLDDGVEPYRRMAERCAREVRLAEERRRQRVEQLMRVEVRMLLERDLMRLEGFWSHHCLPCSFKLTVSRDTQGEDLWHDASEKLSVPHEYMALFLLHMRKTRQIRFKFLPPGQALRQHLQPHGAPHSNACDPPHLVVLCVVSRGYDPHTLEWQAPPNSGEVPHEILRWSDDVCLLIVKYFCPIMQRLVTLGCYYCHTQETLECMVCHEHWLQQRLKPFIDRKEVAPLPDDAYRDDDGTIKEDALLCWEEYCYKNPKDIMERNMQSTIEKEGLFNGDIVIWQLAPRFATQAMRSVAPEASTAAVNQISRRALIGGENAADGRALMDIDDEDEEVLTVRELALRMLSQVPVLVRLHAVDSPLCPEGIPADGVWGQPSLQPTLGAIAGGTPAVPLNGPQLPQGTAAATEVAEAPVAADDAGAVLERELTGDSRWRVGTFAARVAKVFDLKPALADGQALWIFDHGAPTFSDEPPAYRLEAPSAASSSCGVRKTRRSQTLAELLPRSVSSAQQRAVFHAVLVPRPPPGRRRPLVVHFFNAAVCEVGACVFYVSDVTNSDDVPPAATLNPCEDDAGSDSGLEAGSGAASSSGRPAVDTAEVLELARRHLDLPENAALRAKLAPPGQRGETPRRFPLRLVDTSRGRIRAMHRCYTSSPADRRISDEGRGELEVGQGAGAGAIDADADQTLRASRMWPARGENFLAAALRVEPDWDTDPWLELVPDGAAADDGEAQMAEVYHAEQSGQAFGHPFFLRVLAGERLSSMAYRVKEKLGVPADEIRQWRFLLVEGDVVGEADEWPCRKGPLPEAGGGQGAEKRGMQAVSTAPALALCIERHNPAQRGRSPLANRGLRPHKPLTIRAQ